MQADTRHLSRVQKKVKSLSKRSLFVSSVSQRSLAAAADDDDGAAAEEREGS